MCVCEVGRESFCRVNLPMGGKKSKHDSTANGEGQVSALTFYINDLEALQTWNSMGEEAKLQYDHVHIAFKLAPKNANEIKRCLAPAANSAEAAVSGAASNGRGIKKLTLTNQAVGPLPSFREDILARVLKAFCDLCLSLPKLERVNLRGNFIGGRLDVSGKTPAMDPSGTAVKVLCQSLRQLKQNGSLARLDLSLNNLGSAGSLRSSGLFLKSLMSGPGTIASVDLSGNEFSPQCLVHALLDGFVGIEHLDLSHNPVGGYFDGWEIWRGSTVGIKAIGNALDHPSTITATRQLKSLCLVNICMDAFGAEKLAEALKSATCPIERLDVSNNPLSDEGFRHIIGALDMLEEGHDDTLKTAVYTQLEGNTTLQHITCQSVGITLAAIEELVSMNTCTYICRPAHFSNSNIFFCSGGHVRRTATRRNGGPRSRHLQKRLERGSA